jgi:uncharacterized membrane protein
LKDNHFFIYRENQMKSQIMTNQVPEMINPFESPEEITEPFVRPQTERPKRVTQGSRLKAVCKVLIGLLTPAPVCCALIGMFASDGWNDGWNIGEGLLGGLFIGFLIGNIVMIVHNTVYTLIMSLTMWFTRNLPGRVFIHFGLSITLGVIAAATLDTEFALLVAGGATGLIVGFFLWLLRDAPDLMLEEEDQF